MLEMAFVSWSNFLSYGDYTTTIDLTTLGQCLITGFVNEDENNLTDGNNNTNLRRSNGAGKSTIPNAILWCLFGKTMHSATPGDKVVNYFTGKDCWVKVTFKNGDYILRTRKANNSNELFYVKDGDENCLTSDTLSIPKQQQAKLDRVFSLDYDLFCGSSFCTQYAKPWLEIADATRKKAFERLLHVDRFTYYAKIAKAKTDTLDASVVKRRSEIDSLKKDLIRLENEVIRVNDSIASYDANRRARIEAQNRTIEDAQKHMDAIVLPDLAAVKKKWAFHEALEKQLRSIRIKKLDNKQTKISAAKSDVRSMNSKIAIWKEKKGKMCGECEQTVEDGHTQAKIEPLEAQLREFEAARDTAQASYDRNVALIKKIEGLIEKKRPKMTVSDAQGIITNHSNYQRIINNARSSIAAIEKEASPHADSLLSVQKQIDTIKSNIESKETSIRTDEELNKHYSYVYKAYNDRNKIKSLIFKEHLPYLNDRLRHYLDVFKLDIKISISDSLGIDSTHWGYAFESGGERKRTDVAIMLAIFDFHEQVYGRQSNILVLDEIDGRLDEEGIESLVDIIKNDLAHKVETILIISHRNNMKDTFDHEIQVSRFNRLSSLSVI